MSSVFRFYFKLKFISCQNCLKLLGKVHRIIIPLIFISNFLIYFFFMINRTNFLVFLTPYYINFSFDATNFLSFLYFLFFFLALWCTAEGWNFVWNFALARKDSALKPVYHATGVRIMIYRGTYNLSLRADVNCVMFYFYQCISCWPALINRHIGF